ncbi:MAG: CBS domain-containing protein [Candidatus Bathyarchaeota archaeon]|nr:MAG: CBS domain-containing protein [Candidatus Bathyarchaeota archaeon]
MSKPFKKEFPSVSERAYLGYKKYVHVYDIMSRDVLMISPNASMTKAAKVMGDRHVGSLVVVEKEKATGIVTERDLLSDVIAPGKDPKKVKVEDCMSKGLFTIRPIATAKEAAQEMMRKKGRLVVTEQDQVVGIVTAADLIKTLPETEEAGLVDEIMTKEVVTVKANETVASVARMMGKERIGSVLVEMEGVLKAIFTERDLLSNILAAGASTESPVSDFASSPLVTIPSGSSIQEAAKLMAKKHVRRLPVMEGDHLIGILTARDLVEAYSK